MWEKTGGLVLADDSGLVIDYLGGEPGVYSARYMADASYSEKNRVLIERLAGAKEEERSARFACAIAAVLPDGRELLTEAYMEGRIAYEPAGSGGFGYDPILYLPEYQKTSAELDIEEKNKISHRGKALEPVSYTHLDVSKRQESVTEQIPEYRQGQLQGQLQGFLQRFLKKQQQKQLQ